MVRSTGWRRRAVNAKGHVQSVGPQPNKTMKLQDLKSHTQNPRKISDPKLKILKKTLKEYGDISNIIFNRTTGNLVGGHQRLKVMPKDAEIKMIDKDLGYVDLEGDRFFVRFVDWDATKEKAAMIAANKGAGEWDFDFLPDLMLELDQANIDLELTGFDKDEIEKMLAPLNKGPAEGEDDVPEVPTVSKVVKGDLFILGDHRLLCGDSTSITDVERLMNGEKADMSFTSPPYNLGDNAKLRGYNGDGSDTIYMGKTDHKSEQEYFDFLISFTNNSLVAADISFINIQCLAGNKFVIPKYWAQNAERLVDIFIWDKEHAPPQMAERVLNSVWEFIFIFSNEQRPKRSINHGPNFRGTEDNIYRLNPAGKKDELAKSHGGVFPVQFVENFVSKFSDSMVLDLFGGSGSTLIACEKTNRKCFMMEIDEHYCSVILDRWQKFTGKKAYHENGKSWDDIKNG